MAKSSPEVIAEVFAAAEVEAAIAPLVEPLRQLWEAQEWGADQIGDAVKAAESSQ